MRHTAVCAWLYVCVCVCVRVCVRVCVCVPATEHCCCLYVRAVSVCQQHSAIEVDVTPFASRAQASELPLPQKPRVTGSLIVYS